LGEGIGGEGKGGKELGRGRKELREEEGGGRGSVREFFWLSSCFS